MNTKPWAVMARKTDSPGYRLYSIESTKFEALGVVGHLFDRIEYSGAYCLPFEEHMRSPDYGYVED